jgi:hypothetical protein
MVSEKLGVQSFLSDRKQKVRWGQLWNNTSRVVKDAKTKWAVKKAIKEYIRGLPM